jgi:hypothetical protein
MSLPALSDRYYASIPGDDPRFHELRRVLASVKQTGRHSPASRMLGEWALLGFLLSTGQLGWGEAQSRGLGFPADLPDPRDVLAARQQLEAAAAQLGGFEE